MDSAELFLKLQEKLDEENVQCTVCLSSKLRFRTIILPCLHQFCGICLFQWAQQNDSCPICRRDITKICFDVQSPTQYIIFDSNKFIVQGRLWRDQLFQKYHSSLMLVCLKENRAEPPKVVNYTKFSSFDMLDTSKTQKEQLFLFFCFNESYLPMLKVERDFCLKELQKRPGYKDRLVRFLLFYLQPYAFYVTHEQRIEEIIYAMKYSETFEEFLLDFKIKLIKMSEAATPFLPYNFTKRLEYEFFTFAISSKEEYGSFLTETTYFQAKDFNGEYDKLMEMIRKLDREGSGEAGTAQDNALVPSPIQNAMKLDSKEIHEFRRYIRLALKSDHWFKHLARYIVSKSIPGKHQSVLSHRTFKYLEPFIKRIIRIRGIVDVHRTVYERDLLGLLVHENKSH